MTKRELTAKLLDHRNSDEERADALRELDKLSLGVTEIVGTEDMEAYYDDPDWVNEMAAEIWADGEFDLPMIWNDGSEEHLS